MAITGDQQDQERARLEIIYLEAMALVMNSSPADAAARMVDLIDISYNLGRADAYADSVRIMGEGGDSDGERGAGGPGGGDAESLHQ